MSKIEIWSELENRRKIALYRQANINPVEVKYVVDKNLIYEVIAKPRR